MNKRRQFVFALVSVALLSAACGSADTGVDDAAATSAQATTTTVPDTTTTTAPDTTTTTRAATTTTVPDTTTTTAPDATTTTRAATTTTTTRAATTTTGVTTTAASSRPGKFSDFNGADAATWQQMHADGEVVACYEGIALPLDSFCLDENFRFSADYSQILDVSFMVIHLPDGEGVVLQGSTTFRAGGSVQLGWITYEKIGADRVITHLEP